MDKKLKALNVKGKVVVVQGPREGMDGSAIHDILENLKHHGAVGLVFLPDGYTFEAKEIDEAIKTLKNLKKGQTK